MNLKSLFVSNNVFTILFPTTVKYDGSKNKRKKKKKWKRETILEMIERSCEYFVSILYNWWLDWWMMMKNFYWVHPKVAWLAQNGITKWSIKWNGKWDKLFDFENKLSYKNGGGGVTIKGFFLRRRSNVLNW